MNEGIVVPFILEDGIGTCIALNTDDQSRVMKQEQAILCAVSVLCAST